jgi:hypothetical protein
VAKGEPSIQKTASSNKMVHARGMTIEECKSIQIEEPKVILYAKTKPDTGCRPEQRAQEAKHHLRKPGKPIEKNKQVLEEAN